MAYNPSATVAANMALFDSRISALESPLPAYPGISDSQSEGQVLTRLSNPFGATPVTYATTGTVPPQVKLYAGNKPAFYGTVQRAGGPVAPGTVYSLGVVATAQDGRTASVTLKFLGAAGVEIDLWGDAPDPQGTAWAFLGLPTKVVAAATVARVHVRLAEAMNRQIVYGWRTNNGSGADGALNALANVDYQLASGLLVFRPGEVEKIVEVTLIPGGSKPVGKYFTLLVENSNRNFASGAVPPSGEVRVEWAAVAEEPATLPAVVFTPGARKTGRTLVFNPDLSTAEIVTGGNAGRGTPAGGAGGVPQLPSHPPGFYVQTGNGEVAPYAHASTHGSAQPHLRNAAGDLVLRAERVTAKADPDNSSSPTYDYMASMVTTRGVFEYSYGYIEAEFYLPTGQSRIVPAVWTLAVDRPPWEVDILEWNLSDGQKHSGATHYNPPAQAKAGYAGPNKKSTGMRFEESGKDGAPGAWHTFGFEGTPDWLIWYVDGVEVKRDRNPAFFQRRGYILLNIAVGGLCTNPDANTPFPQTMSFRKNGLRVYQSAAEMAIDNADDYSALSPSLVGRPHAAVAPVAMGANLFTIAGTQAKAEGNGNGATVFSFPVTREQTQGTAAVSWAVTGTGANPAAAADFVGGAYPSGTLVFDDYVGAVPINVSILADGDFEQDETFTVTISNPTVAQGTAALGTVTTAVGTVTNDDQPIVTSFSDDFNRSNGTLGANWQSLGGNAGDIFISGNVVAAGGLIEALAAPNPGASNNYVEFDVAQVAASVGHQVVTRLTDHLNWVGVRAQPGGLSLFTCVAGAFTNVGTTAVTMAVGDRIRLEAFNGTYTIKRRPVSGSFATVATYTPATLPPLTTRVGIVSRQSTAAILDNWADGVL